MILSKPGPENMTLRSAEPWWGEFMAQYFEAAKYVRGAKVLDIGCGAGFGTRFLFDQGASEITGVDLNPGDIVSAQEKNGRDGVSFISADAKQLPFAAKSFDVITCFQVLESTTSCDQVLEQVKRLLAAGGTAFLSTVNRRREDNRGSLPVASEHVQEFDRDEFRILLKKNFVHCEVHGLICRRNHPLHFLAQGFFWKRGAQNKTLEFVKDQLENRIPWKVREVVSQKVFGTSYYPAAADYTLVDPTTHEAPLFFAVCRS